MGRDTGWTGLVAVREGSAHSARRSARLIDVSEPTWSDGGVGRMLAGDNAGMFVKVERDSSGAGFHIWLSERHPDDGPSRECDIWADSAEQVDEWFVEELTSVEWL